MDARTADYRARAWLVVVVILGGAVAALWKIEPSGYQLFTAAVLVCILIALVLVVAELATIRAVFTAGTREAELAAIRTNAARSDINQGGPAWGG